MTGSARADVLDLTRYARIHFVGIGGIGMSALARLLAARGYEVDGSDRTAGQQTYALQDAGITVRIGHHPDTVAGADLVVITSAVKDDNPEVLAARQHGIPVVKRAEVLGAVANAGYGVAVAGTHGKTTTSSLIAFILTENGQDPTALLGGVSKNLGSNMRFGAGNLVVVEADEYDATFLCLRPHIAVITNVAAEHLDFFGTEEHVFAAFRDFARGVRDVLVICADDPALPSLVAGTSARVVTYGLTTGDWRGRNVREEGGRMRFEAEYADRPYTISTQLAGTHNALNVLAAAAVCHSLGVEDGDILDAVERFAGIGRRFDFIGEAGDILLLDDYAVHPTEVRATLAAVRARFGRPIRVVFQPHTYSRARDFMHEFSASFGDAHAVYVMDVYAARETDSLGVSGRSVTEAIARLHPDVTATGGIETTANVLGAEAQPGDVIVTMGAGDVTTLGPLILQRLRTR